MDPAVGDGSNLAKIQLATDTGEWFWMIFLTLALIFGWRGTSFAIENAQIRLDWAKQRCVPFIMPFAGMQGFDAKENFNYCTRGIFDGILGEVLAPFAQIQSIIIKNIQILLGVLTSLRTAFATMIGGLRNLVADFLQRLKLVLAQIQTAGLRLQFLMKRVFATFQAAIQMALSGIQAGQNFSETIIFKFMDTFCFAPETLIDVDGKGRIPISEVKLGDVILAAIPARVTTVQRFAADGQPMVQFGEGAGKILVSTNHQVLHNNKFIRAEHHPNAKPAEDWSGGSDRPLICLDTDMHIIRIGDYVFSDYDETSDSDEGTMKWVEKCLNSAKPSEKPRPWLQQPVVAPETRIRMAEGPAKAIQDIRIGDVLSTGRVVGIARRNINDVVQLKNSLVCSPSTLRQCPVRHQWQRAGHQDDAIPQTHNEPIVAQSLVVMKSGQFEAEVDGPDGPTVEIIRDFVEVHSPDAEKLTAEAVLGKTVA